MMRFFPVLFCSMFLMFSCSDNIDPEDYRLRFTGIYDSYKESFGPYPSPEFELLVRIDSSSNDMVYVGEELVPIDENGFYGPDELRPSYYYELRLQNDSLFLRTYQVIINGIVAPCTFYGVKRD